MTHLPPISQGLCTVRVHDILEAQNALNVHVPFELEQMLASDIVCWQ